MQEAVRPIIQSAVHAVVGQVINQLGDQIGLKIDNNMAQLLEINSKNLTDLRTDIQAELDTVAEEMHDHLRAVRQEVRDSGLTVTSSVNTLMARLSNITISLPPLDANQMGEKQGKALKRRVEDQPEETPAKRLHR